MEAYIDESGDEGTEGRGTRWLVFGCACVADAEVERFTQMLHAARMLLGRGHPRDIHCREMRHADRKGILQFLSAPAMDWCGTIVATDTTKQLPGSWLRHPAYQYNYALRYGIERVSSRAAELGEQATIYIEQRRNFDLADFRFYMTKLKRRGERRIDWAFVDPVRIHVAQRTAQVGLCVADALAHAGFKSLEPDPWWGHFECGYLEIMKGKLWRGPGTSNSIHQYGFVLMPAPAWGTLVAEYPWVRDL